MRPADSGDSRYTAAPQANASMSLEEKPRMHVAPIDLRAVRQGGLSIRFALLGNMAYALAEIPATGSTGTSLEEPCEQPHWGMVIDGELTFESSRRRLTIPAGRVFHV